MTGKYVHAVMSRRADEVDPFAPAAEDSHFDEHSGLERVHMFAQESGSTVDGGRVRIQGPSPL